MTKRRRQKIEPLIPVNPTANINATMRAETRGEAPEVFENFDSKNNSFPSPPPPSSSAAVSGKSTVIKERKPDVTFVTDSQAPIEFEADLITVYSQSSGTGSYDSFQPGSPSQFETLKTVARLITYKPPEVQVAAEQNLLETDSAARQPSVELYRA